MSKRKPIPIEIRRSLPKVCCNCGSTENLIFHHIVPVSVGGKNIASNIAVVCPDCHGAIHQYDEIAKHGRGDKIKERLAKAKAEGRNNGRKPADYEHIMWLIAKYSTQFNNIDDANYELHTETEIMEMAGVKPVCYAKCKRMLIDAMKSDVWPYDWEKPKVFNNRSLYDRVIKKMRGGSLLDHQKVGALNG